MVVQCLAASYRWLCFTLAVTLRKRPVRGNRLPNRHRFLSRRPGVCLPAYKARLSTHGSSLDAAVRCSALSREAKLLRILAPAADRWRARPSKLGGEGGFVEIEGEKSVVTSAERYTRFRHLHSYASYSSMERSGPELGLPLSQRAVPVHRRSTLRPTETQALRWLNELDQQAYLRFVLERIAAHPINTSANSCPGMSPLLPAVLSPFAI